MSDNLYSHLEMKTINFLGVFELLFVTFCCILLVWFLQYHWNRRRLYKFASKLPGPYPYPVVGSAMSFLGSPYEIFSTIMRMFNEYSEHFIVWFGPRCFYATSSPKHYEILLPHCLEKEQWYDRAKFVVGEGLFTAPYEKWKKHRKFISPTFNQKILDGFVEIFNEQSEILVRQLQKYSNQGEFDLFHVISKCTLDIICESAMGLKIHAQTTDASFTSWVDKALEIVFLRIFVWWYHVDPLFKLTEHSKEMLECRRNILKFTSNVVKEKKRKYSQKIQNNIQIDETPKRKIFLDYLLDISHKDNLNFSEEELQDEVNTFIIAGSDTTATTNCFIFSMLGLHQDIQDKVYKEILEVIGPDRAVEPSDLPKLKYLEMCIKETLRLFPVAGFILRAIDQDVDVGDFVIPKGVSVIFGFLRTQTNAKYWPDPFKFNPDRFLSPLVHPCVYVPFSYGPRNCIGFRYAMMAMKSLVVTVLRKYKVFTNYKRVEDVKLKCNLILRPKNGFKVYIEAR